MAKKAKRPVPQGCKEASIKSFLDMIAPSVVSFMPDHFICGNTYSRSIKEDIGKRDTFLTDGIKNTSFNDTAILSLQCLTENQQTYQPKKNTILHSCIF